MAKNSFILYHDYYEALADLTDEQVGKLFRAIFEYEIDKKEPSFSGELKVAFKFIKKDLDINLDKYESICERNKINGQKGGRPKNPNNPKNPNGFSVKTQKPKKADNDNDNDNDNDIKEDVIEEKETTTTTLKQLFPNLIEDEPLRSNVDVELLRKKIEESRFLKVFKFVKVSWINSHYELIVGGYYKDFEFTQGKKAYTSRNYTEEELNALFDDLDMFDEKGEKDE